MSILEAALGDLTQGGSLSVLPPAVVGDWDLPEGDRAMLFSHGLPAMSPLDKYLGIGAAFQEGVHPEYMSDGGRCYVIGVCGSVRIVARESSGSVLAVPEVRELIPQLAHLHPDCAVTSRSFRMGCAYAAPRQGGADERRLRWWPNTPIRGCWNG